MLFCIPKILKNESNSQQMYNIGWSSVSCFVSQRYWKMKSSKGKARRFGVAKAIHNQDWIFWFPLKVVLYPKDTEKWKQFTTRWLWCWCRKMLFCIPKILKNESNSQLILVENIKYGSCFVSQRYWKMKAIHNIVDDVYICNAVVLYPKDTEKWKQFTTQYHDVIPKCKLFCIPKILKNESNSQQYTWLKDKVLVVLYPKDTEKWKQFTTRGALNDRFDKLFCIPKILKNEI